MSENEKLRAVPKERVLCFDVMAIMVRVRSMTVWKM